MLAGQHEFWNNLILLTVPGELNAHSGQNQPDNFGETFQVKAYLEKYLKEKYLSEQYQQLSIKYFVK